MSIKYTDPKFVVYDLDDFSKNEEEIRGYLQSDCWELEEKKRLEITNLLGETWIRIPIVDF